MSKRKKRETLLEYVERVSAEVDKWTGWKAQFVQKKTPDNKEGRKDE